MALIAVLDDDAGTRMLVTRVLQKEGHEVICAEDGQSGLATILQNHPSLIVSDVQMPHLDGFGVLQAVRANEDLSTTPVILLTSLDDRNNMRHGMTHGADDYLTKPFTPAELLASVRTQLDKLNRSDSKASDLVERALLVALEEQKEKISRLYERRLEKVIADQWPTSTGLVQDERFASATILYADLANYDEWSRKLSTTELGQVIKLFYANAGDTVYLFGAHYMHFIGNGLLCVFVDADDTNSVNHAMRAAKTALALQAACSKIDAYVATHMPDRKLPQFQVNSALHTDSVIFTELEGAIGTKNQLTPVGKSVSIALNLYRDHQGKLSWPISVTTQTLKMLGGNAIVDQQASVQIAGETLQVHALKQVATR